VTPTDSQPQRGYPGAERRWRLGLTLALAAYGALIIFTPGTYRWLDSLDLAIHETGHLVFAFGGEFLTLLGGTIAQLLVPAAFAAALWRQGDPHGATVPLWWLGQSFTNVAVYIRDARAQELPLVGGGEHDWFLILERFGLLASDVALARFTTLLGAACMVAATVLGWRALQRSAQLKPTGAAPNDPRHVRRTLRPSHRPPGDHG
jgi:hypothetical protein